MKLRMYMDLNPNSPTMNNGIYLATTVPPTYKSQGNIRVAFDVHIPEDILYKPDRFASEISKVTVVEDTNESQS